MHYLRTIILTISLLAFNQLFSQIVINEGSNRNYSNIADENGEFPDWIELYNAGNSTVSLYNYSLTDDSLQSVKWKFPNVSLAPGKFMIVFCSGKDRKPVTGFINVLNTGTFVAQTGWNIHVLSKPFYWDGVSNLLINTCSYSSAGYTSNSVFYQTPTTYFSTAFQFQDGSDGSCYSTYGSRVAQRPNMRLNGHTIGTGQIQNSPYDYPAPYGNWYWGSRHQMLIKAAELSAAGLPIGNINSLAFNVASTDPNTTYDYIDFNMKLVTTDEVSQEFVPVDTNNFLHTNFKLSSEGETVFLYSPGGNLVSKLHVNCGDLDNSTGRQPDGYASIYLFQLGTPVASNNESATYSGYLLPPSFSMPSGIYSDPFVLTIINPNGGTSSIHYTIDGSEPSMLSPLYSGPFEVMYSQVVKARAFDWGILPSQNKVASYLFNIEHSTPVLSVVTDQVNLYGEKGIFDNWWTDWEKSAYVEYFDSTQQLIFSQRTGMQIDGGWGGARYQPQHSFRLELDDGVLGDGHIHYKLIPGRPDRTKYSRFYLRNGSNQYLTLPYKDDAEVTSMGRGLNNYYSAWRPISVYINGNYFGLYELREKIDAEYFEECDGADNNQMDILTLSAWYGFVLRATEGSVQNFIDSYIAFVQLDPADTAYWKSADNYFDLTYYTDYVIGETWIANTDWPGNNIKIYRSDASNFRWRFCLVDLELSLQPNGWTDINSDMIRYILDYDANNPYINIWKRSMQNPQYAYYFINRYADVMNTAYLYENISSIENQMYDLTVMEMPKEYARWGDANNIPQQMATFTDNHNILQSQFAERSNQVRNHIQTDLNLPNQVDVTLNVYPEGAGKIHISTITPETYPWSGIYFNGVLVKIEAIANEGYNFLNWAPNSLIADTLNPVFLDVLNTDAINFEAYFEEIATGLPSNAESKAFTVYPNPATDHLYIMNNISMKDAYYQLIDVNGRTVQEGNIENDNSSFEINIQFIPDAVYLLRITDRDKTNFQYRIVKL
jgi:hypothetical protein